MKKENPSFNTVDSKDNIDWGTHMGNYMIIISSQTVRKSDGCSRFIYGVGFGENNYSGVLSGYAQKVVTSI